jgi:hypothetical protein
MKVPVEVYEDESSKKYHRRQGRKATFESDFMEVEELVEEYKDRKKKELMKEYRRSNHRDKYWHDGD